MRASRSLGPATSFEIKGALRLRDGDFYLQPIYTVALSNRWRLDLGGAAFGGPASGFFGQYAENAHASVRLRYTF